MVRRPFLLTVAVVLAALVFMVPFLDYGINVEDEGTLLAQIARIADGQTPYIDFHIGYTPGIYYVHGWLMSLFGQEILAGRWLLILTVAASLGFLHSVTARITGRPVLALLAPFLYLASIPVHPGEFAAFNIPYPVWYTVLLWVAGAAAILRYLSLDHVRWLFLAGAAAGLSFAFKPNVGLFQLAATSWTLLAWIRPGGQGEDLPGGAALDRLLWWIWWGGTGLGLAFVFSGGASVRDAQILLGPVAAAAALVVVSSRGMGGQGTSLPARAASTTRSVAGGADATIGGQLLQAGVLRSAAAMAAGFLLCTVPWLAWFVAILGVDLFLERVLFIGADFEKFYFISHPKTLGASVLVLAASLGLVRLPVLLRRFSIPPGLVLAAGALAGFGLLGWLASVRPMPQGFYAAVMGEVEGRILGATVGLHWVGILAWASVLWRGSRQGGGSVAATRVLDARVRDARLLGLACIGAPMLYLAVYPRTDFMHWVTAAPMSLVLLTVLLSRAASFWGGEDSRWMQALAGLSLALPLVFVGGMRVWRSVDAQLDVKDLSVSASPMVRLDSAAAPLRINAGRAVRYAELDHLLRFLKRNTRPGEKIFAFPQLELVSFLSGRQGATRHGYFFPGWPGHDIEAEVIDALEAAPPRFAIVLHDHAAFFGEAPSYYHLLGEMLEERYRPYARFGRYLVMAHRLYGPEGRGPEVANFHLDAVMPAATHTVLMDAVASPDPVARVEAAGKMRELMLEGSYTPLLAALRDGDEAVREAAVRASEFTRSPEVSRALLRGVLDGTVPPQVVRLAIRSSGAGVRVWMADTLRQLAVSEDSGLAHDASNLLWFAISKERNEEFWAGRHLDFGEQMDLGNETEEALRQDLQNPSAPKLLQVLATRVVGGSRPEACLADAVALGSDGNRGLRVEVLRSLMIRGCYDGILRESARLAMDGAPTATRILRRAIRRRPEEAARILPPLLRDEAELGRTTLIWAVAGLTGPELLAVLEELALSGDDGVRLAANWAKGRASGQEVVADLY